MSVAGKTIVLGVTGGISAYKAVEVCRRLVDAGAHVAPIMTEGAERFVGRTTLSALASEPVQASIFDERDPIPHTRLGQSADLVVVAQSLGGFTGPLVCDRVPVDLLVMLAAMVPRPGETGDEWWENVGFEDAFAAAAEADGREVSEDFDSREVFFHDVPDDVTEAAFAQPEHEPSAHLMEGPWPLASWPDVRTRVLLCRDDRFFPAPLQRRIASERLGMSSLRVAAFATTVAFLGIVTVALLVYVLDWHAITVDKIFGAVAAYILIAFTFASLFGVLQLLEPNAFYVNAPNEPDGHLGWHDLMYFSFTVLTSTGFGEITPVTNAARSLIVIEQLLGVMYVAFLIARLANLYGRPPPE